MADTPLSNSYSPVEDEESEMAPLNPTSTVDDLELTDSEARRSSIVHYRVYKRRFFGLVQLVLLNIIVSWDVRSPSPASSNFLRLFLTWSKVADFLGRIINCFRIL